MKWIFVHVSSCSCSLCEGVRGQSWLKVPAEVLFWGGRSLVPTGKVEHVKKDVLAKSVSVGDTASFLQFLGIQKYLFWRKCVIIAGEVHSRERKKL